MMIKKFIKKLVLSTIVVCAALWVLCVVTWIFVRPNPLHEKADQILTQELKKYLIEPGDSVAASVVHPKSWDKVCVVPPYVDASAVARDALKINVSELVFIDSRDASVQDDMWGLAFLSAPNKVEYRQISTKDSFEWGTNFCRDRGAARFTANKPNLGSGIGISFDLNN